MRFYSSLIYLLFFVFAEPVSALTFEYTFKDNTEGDFASHGWLDTDSLFQKNVRAAGNLWASRIESNATVRVHVIANRTVSTASASFYGGRTLDQDSNGNTVFEPSPLTIILKGSNPGAPAPGDPDIVINVNPQKVDGSAGTEWLDTDPDFRTGTLTFDRGDFISTILHEIGHGLGVVGYRVLNGSSYGQLPGSSTLFETLTSFDGDGEPLDSQGNSNQLLFNGAESSRIFGGPVPVTSVGPVNTPWWSNFTHLGTCDRDSDPALIAVSVLHACYPYGLRQDITALDLALFADQGYPTRPVYYAAENILRVPAIDVPNSSGGSSVFAVNMKYNQAEKLLEIVDIASSNRAAGSNPVFDPGTGRVVLSAIVIDPHVYRVELELTTSESPLQLKIVNISLL